MARELVLDVVARKSSRDLQLLAAEFEALSKEVDDSGKHLQKFTTFSAFVDDQAAKTRVELAKLKDEFQRTGNLDVASKIAGTEKNLKSLEQLSKRFATSVETGITTGGKSGLTKLVDGLKSESSVFKKEFEGGLLKSLFTTPTGVAGVVGGATLLGNAIGGAVLTGIGLAGIGGGIAIALHDPAVQPALNKLKSDVGSGLKDAAHPFVSELRQGLDILDRGFLKSLPGIQDTFSALAPEVTTLAHGFSGFLGPVVTGLEHAAVAAKPLIDEFSNNFLPALGNNLGSLFETMAAHSKEAEGGLRALEDTINDTVIVTRDLIPVLAKLGDVLKYGTAGGLEDFEIKLIAGQKALDAYHYSGPKAVQVTDDLWAAFQKATSPAEKLAEDLQLLNIGVSTYISNGLSVQTANDNFQRGLNDLHTQLDASSRSLVGNSDAAITNRAAIVNLISEAEAAREAQIKMAGGSDASKEAIEKANAQYEIAIGKIEAVGTKAGLSKKQLDDLAGQYDINVVLAVDAISNSPLAQLTHAHDPGRYGSAGPPKRAGGGPVSAGMPYIVGDGGVPELFVPSVSGRILPRVPRASGGAGVAVTVNAGTGDVAAALAPVVAHMLRTGAITLTTNASGQVRVAGGL